MRLQTVGKQREQVIRTEYHWANLSSPIEHKAAHITTDITKRSVLLAGSQVPPIAYKQSLSSTYAKINRSQKLHAVNWGSRNMYKLKPLNVRVETTYRSTKHDVYLEWYYILLNGTNKHFGISTHMHTTMKPYKHTRHVVESLHGSVSFIPSTCRMVGRNDPNVCILIIKGG